MRLLTFAQVPRDIHAVAALGAREVLAALPVEPGAPLVQEFCQTAAELSVKLWFVAPDEHGLPDFKAWTSPDGKATLASGSFGVLCRSKETARVLRGLAPTLELMLGPWPDARRGADFEVLGALAVRRVWARAWNTPAEARELLAQAAQADVGLVLAMPGLRRIRQIEADAGLWAEFGPLFEDPRATWAASVRSTTDLEPRCCELMSLRTLLATKPGYHTSNWTGSSSTDDQELYDQTEGFPLIYAELMRHPPPIQVQGEAARAALRLDAPVEWPHAPMTLSAYIHVPFCANRCRFCFCSSNCMPGGSPDLTSRYCDALCQEIDMWASSRLIDGREMSTLYIGGGSPSALPADQLARLIRHALERLPFQRDSAVSIEMAPSSINSSRLDAARTAGATRISLGIQSFSARTLEVLGSAHSADRAERSISLTSAAGFADIDVDLIYGIPGQTTDQLQADIDRASDLGISSGMLFPLHVTPTLLAWWAQTGVDCRTWTARRYREFWAAGDERFISRGFLRFGYSHYKRTIPDSPAGDPLKSGFSRYLYVMPGSDGQLALGPTAVGCMGHRQYENVCSVSEYLRRVQSGHLPVGKYSEPPPEQAALVWTLIEETTDPGVVRLADFEARFGPTARHRVEELLEPMRSRNLFVATSEGYEITTEGVIWMANVQIELLRRAGLPAPRGHEMVE